MDFAVMGPAAAVVGVGAVMAALAATRSKATDQTIVREA